MINRLFLMGVVLWVFSFCPLSFAADVTATGEGSTKQEAINNAIRNATEQALGAYVDSKTMVSKSELIYDKISTASAGYVKGYDVLKDGKDPISEIYKVQIKASIDDFKLKNVFSEFMGDPRAQRTFQETKFDNRSISVVYKPQTGLDLPYDSKAVKTVMNLIEDKLVGFGFRVYRHEDLKRIQGKTSELAIDDESAINIGRQETSDATVIVSFDASMKETPDGYNNIIATVTVKAFDTTTGEVFANAIEKDKTIMSGGSNAMPDGVARVAEKVGPRIVDRITEKMVERFSTNRAKFVQLVFTNTTQTIFNKIEDAIEKTGLKYRISKQTGTHMEVELFSEGDPTSVRSIMRKAFQKEGLSSSDIKAVGSRIVYDGVR